MSMSADDSFMAPGPKIVSVVFLLPDPDLRIGSAIYGLATSYDLASFAPLVGRWIWRDGF
jgi:hypothetical protein